MGNHKQSRRAILYARVSTDEQTKGPSLDEQLRKCREYAAEKGMAVAGEYSESYTGRTLDRPVFQKVLKLLQDGAGDALVVNVYDRLSRNYIDFLVLKDSLEKAGIELHYADIGQSKSDFNGLLTESIHALLAHGERLRIVERSRMGKRGSARRGKAPHAILPYGYRRDDKRNIVIDDEQAEVVRWMYERYAYGNGRNEIMSILRLTEELNERGSPPPSRRKDGMHQWFRGTVANMLASEAYIGKLYWGKSEVNDDGERVTLPKDQWIAIDIPPIIDEELFRICQRRIKRNKVLAKRNRKHQYLLTGHLRCGSCGWSVVGSSVQRKTMVWLGYCCSRTEGRGFCDQVNRYIRADKIEKDVVSWLLKLISDDRVLAKGLEEMEHQAISKVAPKIERRDQIRGMLDKEIKRIERLVIQFSDDDDEVIRDTVSREIRRAKAHKDALNDELRNLNAEIQQGEFSRNTRDRIFQLARKARLKMRDTSYENMRWLLETLEVTAVVYIKNGRYRLDVSCGFPVGGVSIESDTRWWIRHNGYVVRLSTSIIQKS